MLSQLMSKNNYSFLQRAFLTVVVSKLTFTLVTAIFTVLANGYVLIDVNTPLRYIRVLAGLMQLANL